MCATWCSLCSSCWQRWSGDFHGIRNKMFVLGTWNNESSWVGCIVSSSLGPRWPSPGSFFIQGYRTVQYHTVPTLAVLFATMIQYQIKNGINILFTGVYEKSKDLWDHLGRIGWFFSYCCVNSTVCEYSIHTGSYRRLPIIKFTSGVSRVCIL